MREILKYMESVGKQHAAYAKASAEFAALVNELSRTGEHLKAMATFAAAQPVITTTWMERNLKDG